MSTLSRVRPAAIVLSCVLGHVFAGTATLPAQEKIARWHDSLDRGAAAARQTGKPLFVVFRCVR